MRAAALAMDAEEALEAWEEMRERQVRRKEERSGVGRERERDRGGEESK